MSDEIGRMIGERRAAEAEAAQRSAVDRRETELAEANERRRAEAVALPAVVSEFLAWTRAHGIAPDRYRYGAPGRSVEGWVLGGDSYDSQSIAGNHSWLYLLRPDGTWMSLSGGRGGSGKFQSARPLGAPDYGANGLRRHIAEFVVKRRLTWP